MDWQAWGVIVALLAVALSFVMTWRGQRQEREIAEATAARAEAAARISADNAERVIAALETIAVNAATRATALRLTPKVGWNLEHQRCDTYLLRNDGDTTAHDVQVTAHESMIGPEHISGGPDLHAGEALTFTAVRTLRTRDSTIHVTWLTSPNDTERHWWDYPLPPR